VGAGLDLHQDNAQSASVEVPTLPRPALEPRGRSRPRDLSDMIVPCHDRKMGSGAPRQVPPPWVPAWTCIKTTRTPPVEFPSTKV
jgi:hypothetical protein